MLLASFLVMRVILLLTDDIDSMIFYQVSNPCSYVTNIASFFMHNKMDKQCEHGLVTNVDSMYFTIHLTLPISCILKRIKKNI